MPLATSIPKKLVLKKHVNAIHCSNNLTLVQRKLFNALLFNAYHDMPNNNVFTIPSNELCTLIGYNSRDYKGLKKALLGLISLAIEWNLIDISNNKSRESWQASSILSAARLEGGLCTYEYSAVMKEFLYRPEVYGKIDIGAVSKFKSSYGLALYENCIRYSGLQQTPWISIDVFRILMGVKEGKYKAFNDFNKRVLKAAVNEVNSISPIKVKPEIERVNQQAIRIRFKLGKVSKNNVDSIGENVDSDLIKILTYTFALSPEIISSLIDKYSESYIKEKISIIFNSDSYRSGQIRALSGYLVDALKNNYKPTKSSQNVNYINRKSKELQQKSLDDKRYKLDSAYETYVKNQVSHFLGSLTSESYEELIKEFEHYLSEKDMLGYEWFKKHGLDHKGVSALLNQHLKYHPKFKLFTTLLDKEEFSIDNQ